MLFEYLFSTKPFIFNEQFKAVHRDVAMVIISQVPCFTVGPIFQEKICTYRKNHNLVRLLGYQE